MVGRSARSAEGSGQKPVRSLSASPCALEIGRDLASLPLCRHRRRAAGPYQNSTHRVTGRAASLMGDHVCAAKERAITQQPADRGGINKRHQLASRQRRGAALLPAADAASSCAAVRTEHPAPSLACGPRPSEPGLAHARTQPVHQARWHQPAVRSRGVAPCVLEALEAGAAFGNGMQDVEQVTCAPGQLSSARWTPASPQQHAA